MVRSSEYAEPKIVIRATGMVSSLGFSVAGACAAARAGLTRPQQMNNVQFKQEDDGELEGVTAHPVLCIADGFEGVARLLGLVRPAVRDFLRNDPLSSCDPRRTGSFLALPQPQRTMTGIELIGDPELRAEREAFAAQANADPDDQARLEAEARRLHDVLLDAVDLPLDAERRKYFFDGACAFPQAVAAAMADLAAGVIHHAVVSAFDSLVDESVLIWLDHCMRLKTSDNPVGLPPGEAGVVALLERSDTRELVDVPSEVVVESIHTDHEPNHLFSGTPPTGSALFRTIASSLDEIADYPMRSPWLVSNHTGEGFSAEEWGHAGLRLRVRYPNAPQEIVSHPAASFGDTGAASAAVAFCMAREAFARGYAHSGHTIIVSCAEHGSRATMHLKRLCRQRVAARRRGKRHV